MKVSDSKFKKKLPNGGPCYWVTDPDTIPTKNAYQLTTVSFQQQECYVAMNTQTNKQTNECINLFLKALVFTKKDVCKYLLSVEITRSDSLPSWSQKQIYPIAQNENDCLKYVISEFRGLSLLHCCTVRVWSQSSSVRVKVLSPSPTPIAGSLYIKVRVPVPEWK